MAVGQGIAVVEKCRKRATLLGGDVFGLLAERVSKEEVEKREDVFQKYIFPRKGGR